MAFCVEISNWVGNRGSPKSDKPMDRIAIRTRPEISAQAVVEIMQRIPKIRAIDFYAGLALPRIHGEKTLSEWAKQYEINTDQLRIKDTGWEGYVVRLSKLVTQLM